MKETRIAMLHDVLNSTGGLYYLLKPYWKRSVISEDDWSTILACLRRIETACRDVAKKLEAQ